MISVARFLIDHPVATLAASILCEQASRRSNIRANRLRRRISNAQGGAKTDTRICRFRKRSLTGSRLCFAPPQSVRILPIFFWLNGRLL